MNIMICFAGGCLDNTLIASDSQNDKEAVEHYYALSGSGEIGRHFSVPNSCGGIELYGVVRRFEHGNGIIVRVAHVGSPTAGQNECCNARQ